LISTASAGGGTSSSNGTASDTVKRQFGIETNDLRLSANCEAVDAGVVLPNVNDGHQGSAPDLGAYELGRPLPHYGPRYLIRRVEWLRHGRHRPD